jgi:hypothetical protein
MDYLQSLGVTAIWQMPFQVSPIRDDGCKRTSVVSNPIPPPSSWLRIS